VGERCKGTGRAWACRTGCTSQKHPHPCPCPSRHHLSFYQSCHVAQRQPTQGCTRAARTQHAQHTRPNVMGKIAETAQKHVSIFARTRIFCVGGELVTRAPLLSKSDVMAAQCDETWRWTGPAARHTTHDTHAHMHRRRHAHTWRDGDVGGGDNDGGAATRRLPTPSFPSPTPNNSGSTSAAGNDLVAPLPVAPDDVLPATARPPLTLTRGAPAMVCVCVCVSSLLTMCHNGHGE
jgi:hypothetical protein